MPEHDHQRHGRDIAVLIVADVRLYREGLAASLAGRDDLFVVATSGNREDACAKIRGAGVDVVVVDIAVPDSLELIRDLHRDAGAVKVLAFAVADVAADILDCAEAGAAGYVTADATVDDLAATIERIAKGELVCPPKIAAELFRRVAERVDRSVPNDGHAKALTIRERQVLDLIRKGLSNKEIAQRLNIAAPTVKSHVHNLLEKLKVTTRAQAAVRAAFPPDRRRPCGQTRASALHAS